MDNIDQSQERIALVVFDMGDALLYGRASNGKIDYSDTLPWPKDWPKYITTRFCNNHKIPWSIS